MIFAMIYMIVDEKDNIILEFGDLTEEAKKEFKKATHIEPQADKFRIARVTLDVRT